MSFIEIIPCLSDNYAYIIRDEHTNKNILVDAPEHEPIERYLDEKALSLDFILITHHHSDHIDGINYLKNKYSPKIIGASRDKHRLPPLDIEVEEGKQLNIGSKTFTIYDVDGHTVGHIAYALLEDKALFTVVSSFKRVGVKEALPVVSEIKEEVLEEVLSDVQRILSGDVANNIKRLEEKIDIIRDGYKHTLNEGLLNIEINSNDNVFMTGPVSKIKNVNIKI